MRGGLISIVVVAVVLPAGPAAQSADPHAALPERPSVATHAHTVAPGWVEIEGGFERAGANGRSSESLPLTVKLGLRPRLQLTLASSVTHPADGSRTSVDDMSLGIKWRMAEAVPIAGQLAILPSATIPAQSAGLATASLLVIASRLIGPLSLDLNAGYTRREGDGLMAPKQNSLWAAAVGGSLTKRFGWLAELSGSPATSGPAGRAATVNSLVGATANLHESLVVDFAFTQPVSGSDSRAVLVGFVWNVGALWNGGRSGP